MGGALAIFLDDSNICVSSRYYYQGWTDVWEIAI